MANQFDIKFNAIGGDRIVKVVQEISKASQAAAIQSSAQLAQQALLYAKAGKSAQAFQSIVQAAFKGMTGSLMAITGGIQRGFAAAGGSIANFAGQVSKQNVAFKTVSVAVYGLQKASLMAFTTVTDMIPGLNRALSVSAQAAQVATSKTASLGTAILKGIPGAIAGVKQQIAVYSQLGSSAIRTTAAIASLSNAGAKIGKALNTFSPAITAAKNLGLAYTLATSGAMRYMKAAGLLPKNADSIAKTFNLMRTGAIAANIAITGMVGPMAGVGGAAAGAAAAAGYWKAVESSAKRSIPLSNQFLKLSSEQYKATLMLLANWRLIGGAIVASTQAVRMNLAGYEAIDLSMNRIKDRLNESEGAMNRTRKALSAMAGEFGQLRLDLAQTMEDMVVSEGMDIEDATNTTRAIASIASSSGQLMADVTLAATAAAGALTAKGEPVAKTLDQIKEAASLAGVSFMEMAASVELVGTEVAGTTQMSQEEILVLLGVLQTAGRDSQRAGAEISQFLTSVAEGSKAAKAAMAEPMSLSIEIDDDADEISSVVDTLASKKAEIGRLFVTPEGAPRSIIEALPEIKKALDELSAYDQGVILRSFFGENFLAAQDILSQSPEDMQRMVEAIRAQNGEVAMGENIANSYYLSLARFTALIDNISVKIAQAIAPIEKFFLDIGVNFLTGGEVLLKGLDEISLILANYVPVLMTILQIIQPIFTTWMLWKVILPMLFKYLAGLDKGIRANKQFAEESRKQIDLEQKLAKARQDALSAQEAATKGIEQTQKQIEQLEKAIAQTEGKRQGMIMGDVAIPNMDAVREEVAALKDEYNRLGDALLGSVRDEVETSNLLAQKKQEILDLEQDRAKAMEVVSNVQRQQASLTDQIIDAEKRRNEILADPGQDPKGILLFGLDRQLEGLVEQYQDLADAEKSALNTAENASQMRRQAMADAEALSAIQKDLAVESAQTEQRRADILRELVEVQKMEDPYATKLEAAREVLQELKDEQAQYANQLQEANQAVVATENEFANQQQRVAEALDLANKETEKLNENQRGVGRAIAQSIDRVEGLQEAYHSVSESVRDLFDTAAKEGKEIAKTKIGDVKGIIGDLTGEKPAEAPPSPPKPAPKPPAPRASMLIGGVVSDFAQAGKESAATFWKNFTAKKPPKPLKPPISAWRSAFDATAKSAIKSISDISRAWQNLSKQKPPKPPVDYKRLAYQVGLQTRKAYDAVFSPSLAKDAAHFMGVETRKFFDKVTNASAKAEYGINSALKDVYSGIQKINHGINRAEMAVWNAGVATRKGFDSAVKAASASVDSMVKSIGSIPGKVVGAIKGAANAVDLIAGKGLAAGADAIAGIQRIGATVGSAVSGGLNTLKAASSNVFKNMQEGAKRLGNFLKSAATEPVNLFKKSEQQAVKSTNNIGKRIKATVTSLGRGIAAVVGNAFSAMGDSIKLALQDIAVMAAIGGAIAAVVDTVGKLREPAKEAREAIKEIQTTAIENTAEIERLNREMAATGDSASEVAKEMRDLEMRKIVDDQNLLVKGFDWIAIRLQKMKPLMKGIVALVATLAPLAVGAVLAVGGVITSAISIPILAVAATIAGIIALASSANPFRNWQIELKTKAFDAEYDAIVKRLEEIRLMFDSGLIDPDTTQGQILQEEMQGLIEQLNDLDAAGQIDKLGVQQKAIRSWQIVQQRIVGTEDAVVAATDAVTRFQDATKIMEAQLKGLDLESATRKLAVTEAFQGDPDQLKEELVQVDKDVAAERLAILEDGLQKIKESTAESEEERRNKIIETEIEIANLKAEMINQDVAARVEANKQIIDDVKKRGEEEVDALQDDAELQRLAILQNEKLTGEQREKALADMERNLSDAQLAAAETRYADLQKIGELGTKAEEEARLQAIEETEDEITRLMVEQAQKRADDLDEIAGLRKSRADEMLQAQEDLQSDLAQQALELQQELQTNQEEFEDQQAQEKLDFEGEVIDRRRKFENEVLNRRRKFDQDSQKEWGKFQKQQADDKAKFEMDLQKRIADMRKSEDERIIDQQNERDAALKMAKTSQERADLQKQFAEEDKKRAEELKVQQEVSKANEARRQQLLAEAERKGLYDTQTATEERRTEEELAAFRDQQTQAQSEFWEGRDQQRSDMEDQIIEDRAQLESDISDDRAQFLSDQQKAEKEFLASQRQLQADFQTEQQNSWANFWADQREADRDNAEAIMEIYRRGNVAPTAQESAQLQAQIDAPQLARTVTPVRAEQIPMTAREAELRAQENEKYKDLQKRLSAESSAQETQRQADATHRETQRQADLATAREIADLFTKAGNIVDLGNLPARRDGGSVSAGTTYLVGEAGPELFTPGISGGILPADQTAALMSQFLGNRPNIYAPTPATETLHELKAIRSVLGNLRPGVGSQQISIRNTYQPDGGQVSAMVERSQLALLRSLSSTLGG